MLSVSLETKDFNVTACNITRSYKTPILIEPEINSKL